MREKPGFPAYSCVSWEAWLNARPPGWRRSADRTRLQANSLLTGNFTGKFAISRVQETISEPETAVPQGLFKKFPRQINSENISENREFIGGNREFRP
jgi:hypothetical protein